MTYAEIMQGRYMCSYLDEGAALELCWLLDRYGIKARVLPPVAPQRPSSCSRVYLANGADYDRAVGFKRGLQMALSMRGDPGAFAEGILAGAALKRKAPRQTPLGKHKPGWAAEQRKLGSGGRSA